MHVTGFAPTHDPFWHASVCVHALPSLHGDPFGPFVCAEHTPVLGLHVPATLQVAPGQVIAGPAVHAPLWQVSPTVQALLSVQVAPFAAGMHVPVAVAHTEQVPQTAPLSCHVPVASHF